MGGAYACRNSGLQRLEKIMDEYVGGISTAYMTNGLMLEPALRGRADRITVVMQGN